MSSRSAWRTRVSARLLRSADGRPVSSGSVFSTILLTSAVEGLAGGVGGRLLDVGCGESPYRALMAPDFYLGIDWSPQPASAGHYVRADVSNLPVIQGAFDAVLCTEVIEHVRDERVLAVELARAAAPGARLLISSPFVHGLHEQPFDFRRLTSIGLVRVLEGAGWRVDTVVSVGGTVVVALDSLSRWSDSVARRGAARLFGRGHLGFRVVARVSRLVQQILAAAVLSAPSSRVGVIDPFVGDPRLTLGYVVSAHLNDHRSAETRSEGG